MTIADNVQQTSAEALKQSKSPSRLTEGTWLVVALMVLTAWDATGLDMTLARWYGSSQGFAMRDHPWLATVLHDGVRKAGWIVLLALSAGIWWPWGSFRKLTRAHRAWMVGSIWLSLLVVVTLKGASRTSCPWDLAAFGGTAQHVSHWLWGLGDGGPGRCFPGGHASTAFAFLPIAWWLRPVDTRAARRWLIVVIAGGLVLGWVQQVRGAHFFSHNLWTGWLCWALAWGLYQLGRRHSIPLTAG